MGSLAPLLPATRGGSTHLPKTLPRCGSRPPSVKRVPPNPVHAAMWGPGPAVPSLTPAWAGLRTVLKASLQVGDERERLRESLPSVTARVCVCARAHTGQDSWALSETGL